MAHNGARGYGGGASIVDASTPIVSFNIFAGNVGDGAHPEVATTLPFALSGDYNLVENVVGISAAFRTGGGWHNIAGPGTVIPGLAPLQNKGGPTAIHPLNNMSRALDAIPVSGASDFAVRDQRGEGFVRPRDGAAVGNGFDIGAYEQRRARLPGPQHEPRSREPAEAARV